MKIRIQEFFYLALPRLNLVLALNSVLLLTCLWGAAMQPHRSFALDEKAGVQSQHDTAREEALTKINLAAHENMFLQHLLCGTTMRMIGTKDNPTLELVGFIKVQDKRAAMLKDKKTRQSYYCIGGEEINGIIIREIQDKKVIIEAQGMQMEITK